MWIYTVGIFQAGAYMNKTADVPLIQSRTLHWLNYRFGLTGYLHWGYNMWTDDPFEAPGQHCGDGWHVYPTKGGLLDSLRWEQMRNGLQDYEYFRLLEEKVRQMQKAMSRAGFRPDRSVAARRRDRRLASSGRRTTTATIRTSSTRPKSRSSMRFSAWTGRRA